MFSTGFGTLGHSQGCIAEPVPVLPHTLHFASVSSHQAYIDNSLHPHMHTYTHIHLSLIALLRRHTLQAGQPVLLLHDPTKNRAFNCKTQNCFQVTSEYSNSGEA